MALTAEEILAVEDSFLEHSGVKNMKWGQRRYQNPDGSLTALGRIHYGIGKRRDTRAVAKKTKVMQSGDAKTVLKYRKKLTDEEFDTAMARVAKTEALRAASNAEKNAKKQAKQQAKLTKEQQKSAEKIAEANAKTKTNSKDFWGTLGEWGKRAATIASLYKSVSTITTGFGIDMPKFGNKDKGDKSGNASALNVKTFTYNYDQASWSTISKKNEAKSETRKTNKTVLEMPAATDKYVRSGSDIVDDFLSGSVEGTGTHFKDTKTSSFSDNTLAIGMNTVANILALPYDPNKKF